MSGLTKCVGLSCTLPWRVHMLVCLTSYDWRVVLSVVGDVTKRDRPVLPPQSVGCQRQQGAAQQGYCACEPLTFSRLPEFAAHVVSSSPHYLQSSANAQH